ncbi:hypothetical protein ACNKCP_004151, partial [Cronobacter dublinensis]
MRVFVEQIERDRSNACEKTAVERKDRKKGCAEIRDPYNAPPSRRQCEALHEIVEAIREKL